MKYAQKMTCILLLVLALSFGVGGCALLYGDFAARLARTDELNAAAHAQSCAAMDSLLRSRSRQGEEMDRDTLTACLNQVNQTGAIQVLSYPGWESGALCVILSEDGEPGLTYLSLPEENAVQVYVGVVDDGGSSLTLRDGQQGTLREEGIRTKSYYFTRLWGGYTLLTAFDLTPLYADRADSLQRFLVLEAAVLLCAAAVIGLLARRMTRPLGVLTAASAQIAAGDYDRRTALRTGDEVEEVSRSFDRMADAVQEKIAELEKSVQQREDFMGAFTHELKTPMTSIIGYADMLRTLQADPGEQLEAADAIYHEGRRLETLAQKLLELLELSDQPLTLTDVALPEVFALLARLCRNVPLQLPEGGPTVRGDADLLADLLYNLVNNAVKASQPGQPVRLLCAEAGGWVRLTVADRGRGIPPGELSRVAEPFYMVDKSRARRQGGSGLGLALCQRIAAAHGGTLEIESELGRGTRVTVCLQKGGAADETEA